MRKDQTSPLVGAQGGRQGVWLPSLRVPQESRLGTRSSMSAWLGPCRADMMATPEWQAVKDELLQRLKQEVTQRGISHLSALSEEEKLLLLLQVQPTVMAGSAYKVLLQATSRLVGRHLLDVANDELVAGSADDGSKAARIVDIAAAGAAALLVQRPQAKAACGPLLNSPHIPQKLRLELWQSWLERPLIAAHFVENAPSRSLSIQYQLVAQTTSAVLNGDVSDQGKEPDDMPLGPTPSVAAALAAQVSNQLLAYYGFIFPLAN